MELFGLQITKVKPKEDKSASFAIPVDEDGGTIVSTSANAAYYGVYMDVDGMVRNEIQQVQKYREISLYPEVDVAIQDIVNESIPHEDNRPEITINLDDLDLSDELKEKITEEFKYLLTKLKYNELSSDIFRRWYVDGRLFYHIIVDKENLQRGIVELRLVEATKIRKVREVKKGRTSTGVDIIESIEEYFIYNESGFASSTQGTMVNTSQQMQGIKLSPDAIIYVPSGYFDNNSNTVLSYLHKAIRSANQLRMLEDATVVYFIARAPERRIFYVDVGTMPKLKAEQYVKDIMNRYRNKMVYDAKTGEVRDDKKYMSMLEDFWMPRRDGGKGTEITTLDGAQNQQGMMLSVEYFQKKMYQALNVPVSRLQPDEGFTFGKTTEISRDEVKFQKFIDRLRKKFSELFYEALRVHLTLKGVCNNIEWEEMKEKIRFSFQKDNYFSELLEQDVIQTRLALLPQVDQYLGKYFSKAWVQKHILHMDDEAIEEMDKEIAAEASDPTAQPSMQPGMGMGGGMDQFGLGGPPGGDSFGPPGPAGGEGDPADPTSYQQNFEDGMQSDPLQKKTDKKAKK